MENNGIIPQAHGGAIRPIQPGQVLNPGGAPKGKRISTWMAEFGEKPASDWPEVGSKQFEKLPGNAQIALRRLRAANAEEELGLANSKYVEPRELEQSGGGQSASNLIAGIAAAIMALKASGVTWELPVVVDTETVKGE